MNGRRDDLAPWAAPSTLVALTIFGLASALLGDGLWDVLSWVTLAVPLSACAWFAMRGPRRER